MPAGADAQGSTRCVRLPYGRVGLTRTGRHPAGPASSSNTGRSRRSASKRVLGRTPGLKTLARCADHLGRVTQSTDRPPKGGAHVRGSDAPPAADPTFVGRTLENRRMNHPAVSSRVMNRTERRRTEQTYDER
jgi:hypothetical protein